MAVFYIDISGYQPSINLAGWHAVCIKATEGTGYMNPYWARQRGGASNAAAFSFGYHFLHAGNGAGQADYYFAKVGKVPCMVDFEPSSTRPGVGDAVSFTDRLRQHGVPVNALYLPHWYWQQIGSPSLTPFVQRKMFLVTSSYTSYSDSGPGWQGYGGMSVGVWQYTSTMRTGGYSQVDCNAFKGTFAQLQAMITGGSAPVQPPGPAPAGHGVTIPDCAGKTAGAAHNRLAGMNLKPQAQPGQTPDMICSGLQPGIGTDVGAGQAVLIIAGNAPVCRQGDNNPWVRLMQHDLNKANAGIATDGSFGPATGAAVHSFQANHGLQADSVVGPATWSKLGNL